MEGGKEGEGVACRGRRKRGGGGKGAVEMLVAGGASPLCLHLCLQEAVSSFCRDFHGNISSWLALPEKFSLSEEKKNPRGGRMDNFFSLIVVRSLCLPLSFCVCVCVCVYMLLHILYVDTVYIYIYIYG